ncbi:MAG: FkbM family methyltransferase [Tateyamaria sp.]|nr:FkbM family methyltransferase [Tateyamaria sp.]
MVIKRETRAVTDVETGTPAGFFDAEFGIFSPNKIQKMLISVARSTFLHRGKLRHYMTNLIATLGCPLDVKRMDCAFRIEGSNNLIEYGLLLHPGYNKPEIDFLCSDLGSGKVAVDIGSNVGLYAQPLARTGSRVIAVDANPSMIKRLNFNAKSSGLDTLDIVHAAVGDGDGMASLEIHRNDVAIVNIVESPMGSVPIRTLADILKSLSVTRVDALKIDIEGHEDAALAPFLASACEDMIPDRIVIERIGPNDYPGCHHEFTRLGFERVATTRSNSMYLRSAKSRLQNAASSIG